MKAFIDEARSYIGTKWRHRGRSKYGVDCIGLVVVCLQSVGYHVSDRLNYSRTPFKDGLRDELQKHFGDPIPLSEAKEGDIALIRFDGMTEPSHVGIIANYEFGGLSIIHSYSLVAVTEHRLDKQWSDRIVEVYRIWRS